LLSHFWYLPQDCLHFICYSISLDEYLQLTLLSLKYGTFKILYLSSINSGQHWLWPLYLKTLLPGLDSFSVIVSLPPTVLQYLLKAWEPAIVAESRSCSEFFLWMWCPCFVYRKPWNSWLSSKHSVIGVYLEAFPFRFFWFLFFYLPLRNWIA
jgi:hypothetical protein